MANITVNKVAASSLYRDAVRNMSYVVGDMTLLQVSDSVTWPVSAFLARYSWLETCISHSDSGCVG